jgi:truncated hemoglobin YjbI
MFRLDPEWCKRHGHEQITDEELDDLLGQLNVAIHDIETETTA